MKGVAPGRWSGDVAEFRPLTELLVDEVSDDRQQQQRPPLPPRPSTTALRAEHPPTRGPTKVDRAA
jgi:hypothetical protein